MATVSGGSKPTFTVDQVLHSVEMNQLNQEWIVDSVPAGSAGKNGDVVFVTNKGGVWAKVSGSWVQASLTSADMQTLQDQIDTIQSSGYDDTQLRSDFAAADAATLASANTYTDDEIAKIDVPVVDNFATTDYVDAGDVSTLADAKTYTDSKVYDSTNLEASVAQNTIDIAKKFDKGSTNYIDAKAIEDDITGIESSISDLSDNYDQLVIDLGNVGTDLNVELAGYLKKGLASYADAAGIETEIDQEKNDRVAGDETTLTSAKSYTDDEISKVVIPDVSDLTTKDYVDAADATKFDKGATAYADAKAMEDAIKANTDSIDAISSSGGYNDAWIQTAIDTGDATTLASSKTYTDEEVAKVFVPDVSDLATKDELTTGLAGKADEPHTHDDLAAGDHNHDGDYAGKTEFDAHTHDTTHDHFGVYAGKAEFDAHHHDGEYSVEGHTHDTTHDHDADYQPKGDYATKTELGAVDEKADANAESISKLNTSLLPLNVPVDVRAATLTTQEDANGYFATELETKLGQAPTWGQLAGRP